MSSFDNLKSSLPKKQKKIIWKAENQVIVRKKTLTLKIEAEE